MLESFSEIPNENHIKLHFPFFIQGFSDHELVLLFSDRELVLGGAPPMKFDIL